MSVSPLGVDVAEETNKERIRNKRKEKGNFYNGKTKNLKVWGVLKKTSNQTKRNRYYF